MTVEEDNLIRAVSRGATAEAAGERLGLTPSRVDHICRKWAKKGLYTYQVSPAVGWLTDRGRAKAAGSA